MAKNNKGKVIQMLSPENYIRKKARTLPVYECQVNDDWKEQGVAHVIVARKHTNGNITVCFYLVDLFCLGVKNTQYFFNIPEADYQDKMDGMEHVDFKPISYALAHNIVFAGIEFAEEYGFKPHKEFTSVTKFLLEEDTEDVELIDIECGRDGKPFFVSGPFDDQVKINQVIAQLERTAGAGNYDFLLEEEDDEFEDDQFLHLSMEEQRTLFLKLYANRENLSDEEEEQLRDLTEYVIENIIDEDKISEYEEEYLDDFDFEITDDIFTEEMLGLPDQQLSTGTCELFSQIYETINEDPEQASNLLNDFRKETPENPAAYFLELIILRTQESPVYEKKVEEYYSKFPNYSLLKILNSNYLFTLDSTDIDKALEGFTMQSLFAGRTWINHIEAFNFLTALYIGIIRTNNIDRILGLYEACNSLELAEEEFYVIEEIVFLIKSVIVEQIMLSE